MNEPEIIALPPIAVKPKWLITGIILAVAFPYLFRFLFIGSHIDNTHKMLYSSFIFWGEVLVLAAYAYKIEGQPLLIWKERERDLLFFAGSVVLLYLLALLAGFIADIPHLFGMPEKGDLMRKMTAALKGHYVILVFLALTAGFTEELIFRGYLLTRLSQVLKNGYWSVIISAVVFSAVHLGYKSLRELLFTFLIGLMCAFYYKNYRDMKVIITVHFLIDLIAFTSAQHLLK